MHLNYFSRTTLFIGVSLSIITSSLAFAKDSVSTTPVSVLGSYPAISAPANSTATTAIGEMRITGTGATTVADAWYLASRNMYSNVSSVYNNCKNQLTGAQLFPNGNPIKTSANNTYTVKQNFYCALGDYKGWLASHKFTTSATSMKVGATRTSDICLTQAAPTGGVVVKIISAFKRVSVPTSVTVPAGSTCASMTITAIKGSGTENVFAILNGYGLSVMMDVYP